LERTIVTAPILFTATGILALTFLPEVPAREHGHELFLTVAEIGLVLLLFTDASRTDLRMLRSIRRLPIQSGYHRIVKTLNRDP
jgi:NhaP-type Na+/H+ or K+/H+ antiporter